jgi:MarR family transcriptional regulator, lower aerobic nicotinate degradation pathway regulator
MNLNAESTTEAGVSDALLDSLVQTSFTVIGMVTAVAARHDLSLTLLRVAAILRDRSVTMSELAAYLGLDRSTITGLINRAEERGLMRRVGNKNDKRSSRVTLTKAGQALATRCAAEISQEIAPLVARLTPAEAKRLTNLLTLTLNDRSLDRRAK